MSTNTDKTRQEDMYSIALDFLIDSIDKGEIEVGTKRPDGRVNKVIANTATQRLADLINQQVLAALDKLKTIVDESDYALSAIEEIEKEYKV